MANSYLNVNIHYVFSTKNRNKQITEDLQSRLWSYMGGIARNNKMKALIVGGDTDHCHILISIPSTITIAKVIQLIKGNSSKWIHETFPEHKDFEWQKGYGAFSE